ncbi:unnamed protein product [Arctia plantaginis]|uniref:Uncharacterized protein n=1 Tax=Arctia plantaginis TaxID=874455 RepID=A0A8S1AYB6_ARCPL|nr:unnamed protein product [Arctia plantaginis]
MLIAICENPIDKTVGAARFSSGLHVPVDFKISRDATGRASGEIASNTYASSSHVLMSTGRLDRTNVKTEKFF